MKDIVIVGASGFGRELVQWIEDINRVSPEWNILGFIDDNIDALDGYECGYKIIGSIRDWTPSSNHFHVCALAFPKVKKRVVQMLEDRGAVFATIVHPTALVNKYAKIGKGVVVTPRSNINANAVVGDYVSILGSGIGHDAVVGDFSTLSGRCSINGHVNVGREVYVACGVSIAPSKTIGDGATIGIGSVVVNNVKAGITVFGNPAKKIDF